MKTWNFKSARGLRRLFPVRLWTALAFAMVCSGLIARAAEGQATQQTSPPSTGGTDQTQAAPAEEPAAAAAAPATQAAPENAPSPPATEAPSSLVTALSKMADAGVSAEVMRRFVESSPPQAPLTAANIIELKKHKVSDDLVTYILAQGAQARAQEAQRKAEATQRWNQAIAQALAQRNARYGGLDPESYEYFEYYYLHPRALASARRTLLAPYYEYGPRGFYGFGGPRRFGFGYHGYGHSHY